jgi:hypothetical protein
MSSKILVDADTELLLDIQSISNVAEATLPNRAMKLSEELWPMILQGLQMAARRNQRQVKLIPKETEAVSAELARAIMASIGKKLELKGFKVKRISNEQFPCGVYWSITW